MFTAGRFKILIFLIIFSPFLLSPVSVDDIGDDTSGWLILEMGRQAVANRDLGTALLIFEEALNRDPTLPEANLWIGYIYELEGEVALAERQYLRALAASDQFYVPDDELTTLYRLAAVYRNSYQYDMYESVLNRITAYEGLDRVFLNQEESMYRLLLDQGLDQLLTLYRLERRKTVQGYSELGVYYYRTGFFQESVRNLMLSIVVPVTEIVNYIREYDDSEYTFTGIFDFIQHTSQDPVLMEYIIESRIFEDLYYLAASLYQMGKIDFAQNIWQTLSQNSGAGVWQNRSNRQLVSPFYEPRLIPQG